MSKKPIFRIYKNIVKRLAGHKLGKFYPIQVCHKFIVSHLKASSVVIDGNKMFLDSQDSLLLSIRGIYEPFETELVKKEIKKGDVVLDLGAHIGYYTLIFAKLVGDEGRVIAFEPDPSNFALLKKNVEINGFKNVELVNKAVSNQTGPARLYLSKHSAVAHRIYDVNDGCKSIEIEAIRLDEYFINYKGRVDFIKMDIQGAEGAAIQGMKGLLKNNDLKLVMEYSQKRAVHFGMSSQEYIKLLGEYGFKIFDIDEKERKIELFSPEPVIVINSSLKKNRTNLLCLKNP